MSYEVLRSVSDLVDIAGKLGGTTVLIPGGDRVEDIRLVDAARDHGIIEKAILVGNKDKIIANSAKLGVDVDKVEVVDVREDTLIGEKTVELVNAGGVDVVLKGGISTPIINRAMLKLAVKPTVSLASIFDASQISGGRPIVMTDAGVTTVCNFGRMVDLISNSVEVARKVIGIESPKVAVLSANEKIIPSLPSTMMGLELSKLQWDNAVVCGPLSFDLATDLDSVQTKGMPDLPNAEIVAGQADVVVCPGIDSANILYKTVASLVKHGDASIAGITLGFKVPYIILSRSDNIATRLESVALCSVYAQRTKSLEKEFSASEQTKLETGKRVLVVNPGSTSIKLGVYNNENCLFESEATFTPGATDTPAGRVEQAKKLAELVKQELEKEGIDSVDAVSGRGGFLPQPKGKLSGGTYSVAEKVGDKIVVNEKIVLAITEHPIMDHASNLGIPVAAELAGYFNVPAFTVDPVVVDEFSELAEFSGYAPIVRKSAAHALSIRAAAKRAAESVGRSIEDINLVVGHLGGGMTVASIVKGKMVDNTIALHGAGPFTPARAGQLPANELIDLCYSGKFSKDELKAELSKKAGLISYLGTSDMIDIGNRIADGDEKAKLAVDAMVYQIAKDIGAAFVAADCNAEAIVLTGGLTKSAYVTKAIRQRVGRLAPVVVFKGSVEMSALANGAVSIMNGKEKPQDYQPAV